MSACDVDDDVVFLVPARKLSGSRDVMLEEVDQAIVGLLALRRVIQEQPAGPARRRFRGRTRGVLWQLSEAMRSFRVGFQARRAAAGYSPTNR